MFDAIVFVDDGNPAGDTKAVCLRVGSNTMVIPEPFTTPLVEMAYENERLQEELHYKLQYDPANQKALKTMILPDTTEKSHG
jgi:hypothetical protein